MAAAGDTTVLCGEAFMIYREDGIFYCNLCAYVCGDQAWDVDSRNLHLKSRDHRQKYLEVMDPESLPGIGSSGTNGTNVGASTAPRAQTIVTEVSDDSDLEIIETDKKTRTISGSNSSPPSKRTIPMVTALASAVSDYMRRDTIPSSSSLGSAGIRGDDFSRSVRQEVPGPSLSQLSVRPKNSQPVQQYIPLSTSGQQRLNSDLDLELHQPLYYRIPAENIICDGRRGDHVDISGFEYMGATYFIYTDASKRRFKVAAAFVILGADNLSEVYRDVWELEKDVTTDAAETFAIKKALKWVSKLPRECSGCTAKSGNQEKKIRILICSDSQSSLRNIQNPIGINEDLFKITNLYKFLTSIGYEIYMRWIPAHQKYIGNEKADKLAYIFADGY